MYDEACQSYEVVETTKGRNGYPYMLGKAVIGFDTFDDAKDFASRNGGVIVELSKRDGWQFWSVTYEIAGPFVIDENDYGCDYECIDNKSEWWKDEKDFLKELLDCDVDIDDVDCQMNRIHEIEEVFDNLEDGEQIVLHNRYLYEVGKKETMRFRHDVWTSVVGVVDKDDL